MFQLKAIILLFSPILTSLPGSERQWQFLHWQCLALPSKWLTSAPAGFTQQMQYGFSEVCILSGGFFPPLADPVALFPPDEAKSQKQHLHVRIKVESSRVSHQPLSAVVTSPEPPRVSEKELFSAHGNSSCTGNYFAGEKELLPACSRAENLCSKLWWARINCSLALQVTTWLPFFQTHIMCNPKPALFPYFFCSTIKNSLTFPPPQANKLIITFAVPLHAK